MFKMLDGLLDRLFALVGALLFSQAPEFFQQYLQRLSGHISELDQMMHSFETLALRSNKTVSAYIDKFIMSQDPDVSHQGLLMKGMSERLSELTVTLQSLQEASVWSKPFIILKHLQSDIVYGTFSQFKPGISLTLEGGVYAALGLCVGYLFYALLKTLIKSPFSKAKADPA